MKLKKRIEPKFRQSERIGEWLSLVESLRTAA
jgi:hypothetical protein